MAHAPISIMGDIRNLPSEDAAEFLDSLRDDEATPAFANSNDYDPEP